MASVAMTGLLGDRGRTSNGKTTADPYGMTNKSTGNNDDKVRTTTSTTLKATLDEAVSGTH
jgi:hypothetical protein